MTAEVWARAEAALRLLRVDPSGLGGLWLRARSGPVRARFCEGLDALPLPLRKLHPGIGDEALYGGIDLAATLTEGTLVRGAGLLESPAALVLTMAERCGAGLAARLALALDEGPGHALIALDEGAEPEEGLPQALADRLAFKVDLDAVGIRETGRIAVDEAALAAARRRLPKVVAPPEAVDALVRLAARLGIAGLRGPLLALAAAKAAAALCGRRAVAEADVKLAVELVLAPRATVMPEAEAPQEPEPPEQEQPEGDPPPDDPGESDPGELDPETMRLPEDILLEAAKALLPSDLLERLAAEQARRTAPASGGGSGAAQRGNRRGRPLPSRPGRLDGQARIDLVATLRTAAPWQPMRRAAARMDRAGLHIRPGDIHVKRYQDLSDRLLIFTVDASGSAAMSRLGEAKGAVELLLSEAYARRDHVALIAFRGTAAEVLLPPTRSLVQTKRRLGGLPGGGGTPLAAGLRAAMELGRQARARGMTPTICLLTDGRANVALDGRGDRVAAAADAEAVARGCRAAGMAALVIDMSRRPHPALQSLAATLGAPYLPLPRADATAISATIGGALKAELA